MPLLRFFFTSLAVSAMPGGQLIGEGTYAQPDVSWWLNPCAEPEVSAMPYCDESLDSWARALDLSGRLNVTNYLHYWNSTQRGPLAYDGIRIPPMGMVEGIHGAVCGGVVPPSTTTTNFPIGVGMGSSFDRDLVREIGLAVGTEVYTDQDKPLPEARHLWRRGGSSCGRTAAQFGERSALGQDGGDLLRVPFSGGRARGGVCCGTAWRSVPPPLPHHSGTQAF